MSYSHHRLHTEQPLRNSNKPNSIPFHNLGIPVPSNSYLKNFKKNNIVPRDSVNKKLKVSSSNKSIVSNNSNKSINNKYGEHMQFLMQQTDNSMEEMLNSSINHLEKLIIREDDDESLEEQNQRLKSALSKMKKILKDKLENALQRQKDQLSKMLQDYISLITKLLQDK